MPTAGVVGHPTSCLRCTREAEWMDEQPHQATVAQPRPTLVHDQECVFCRLIADQSPLVAWSDGDVAVLPLRDQRPKNRGHMLVIPVRHIRNLHDCPVELAVPLFRNLRLVSQAVCHAFEADGTSVRQNNEPPGQDVFHLHFHVIPRYTDDDDWTAGWEMDDEDVRLHQSQAVARALTELPGC